MKIVTGSFLLATLSSTAISSVQSFAFVGQLSGTSSSIINGISRQGVAISRDAVVKQSVSVNDYKNRSILQAAESGDGDEKESVVDFKDVGFVLLAGGTGSRMKANMPKQFLSLKGVPVLHHSLDLFLERLPASATANGKSGPSQVVLVMDPKYQPDYQPIVDKYEGRLAFANPGKERQGSVENGLNKLVELTGHLCEYVAVHDSARPLVTVEEINNVVRDAKEHGAAVLGVPCKATIKESEDGTLVLRTIPRERLWEVHTPQVIKIDTLKKGFVKVEEENIEVTDDVSIVEAMGEPVKLTKGEYTNLKITTPEDMDVATAILNERNGAPIDLLN
eukprot:CAMPEP_0197828254 /NCGR_PEP_ID=MMETSP1437-20131217/4870_1 /TAXON_ID=49252 ORGANISM="Eucampia antarctica, Strain CCMP1452" /NCGR_SAMPLE_ID=MMETSP1437 /ASSEMBLY_ACC=CAM_ASM_001096 /LENGTH=334 /DNA_ID=CAMNT_0043429419 /DNA_START=48 /DNA_END=1052 /DNA_ORIENTATION=+